jgi:hypothetical protein
MLDPRSPSALAVARLNQARAFADALQVAVERSDSTTLLSRARLAEDVLDALYGDAVRSLAPDEWLVVLLDGTVIVHREPRLQPATSSLAAPAALRAVSE